MDQTGRFLGIYVLPREGTALADSAGADRTLGRQLKTLLQPAVRQRRLLKTGVLQPRLRRNKRNLIVDKNDRSER